MGKTELTKQLEKDIWCATEKMGTFGCFEVTIGFNGRERCDFVTYSTKGIWRCYEVKISKSDFHSKCKNTFVGHFNYYVLTQELYDIVKEEVPKHIGIYVGSCCVKNAKKQELGVSESILKDSMIRSLCREFQKQYMSEDETIVAKLNRSVSRYKSERNKYKKLYEKEIKNK